MTRLSNEAANLWREVEQESDGSGHPGGLVERLAADPTGASDAIAELASIGDDDQQGWVLAVAHTVLGERAVPIINEVIKHAANSDVLNDAYYTLAEVDKALLRPHLAGLRRLLRSKDHTGPGAAIWLLARLGDVESLPRIESLRDDERRPSVRFGAQVASMLLREDGDAILRGIEGHDHLRMPWLTHGARLLGTPAARTVLQAGADGAPILSVGSIAASL